MMTFVLVLPLLICLIIFVDARATEISPTTHAIWTNASLKAKYVFLRPKNSISLSKIPSRLQIFVSAGQDAASQQRILASYRLFVNGMDKGIGPGRSEQPLKSQNQQGVAPNETTIYDLIEIPFNQTEFSLALQCYHTDGGLSAWAVLEVRVFDASNQSLCVFGTNSSWMAYDASSIFRPGKVDQGSAYSRVNEDIDARAFTVAVKGWRGLNFSASPLLGWHAAERRSQSVVSIKAKYTQPLVTETNLQPQNVTRVPCGRDILCSERYFVDFGIEQMAGARLFVPVLTANAWGGAGVQIEVKLSEQVSPYDNTKVYSPESPDLKKVNQYVSIFTLGTNESDFEHHEYPGMWRYAEIIVRRSFFEPTASPEIITKNNDSIPFVFSRWAVAYPWKDEGFFNSSSPMLNRIWILCKNTIKRTSLDTFTDSNTRERLPYEADGYLTVRSWWALQSEYAWPRHSIQHVLNNPTWPTEWKQYTVLLVHEHYMQSGDISLADENIDMLINNTMLPFIDGSSDLVNFTKSRVFQPGNTNSPMCHNDSQTFPTDVGDGDVSCDNIDWLPKFRNGFHFTPVNTIINSFAVRSMELLAELAVVLKRHDTAKMLAQQADRTKAAMLKLMYNDQTCMWCDGICSETKSTSFHAQHYPLWLMITPNSGVAAALEYLREQGMRGSTYSSNSLLHGLFGRAAGLDFGQTALDLMTQCGKHSWCNMLRHGATTSWEHWGAFDGTHSHPWSTTPASAIVGGLMGIRPTASGWTKWIVKPALGNLTVASVKVPTPGGMIEIKIQVQESQVHEIQQNKQISMKVLIPNNTKGTLCLPLYGLHLSDIKLTLDGKMVKGQLDETGLYVCLDDQLIETNSSKSLSWIVIVADY